MQLNEETKNIRQVQQRFEFFSVQEKISLSTRKAFSIDIWRKTTKTFQEEKKS